MALVAAMSIAINVGISSERLHFEGKQLLRIYELTKNRYRVMGYRACNIENVSLPLISLNILFTEVSGVLKAADAMALTFGLAIGLTFRYVVPIRYQRYEALAKRGLIERGLFNSRIEEYLLANPR